MARAARPTPRVRAGRGSRSIRRITGEEAEALGARLAADYRRGRSIRALAEDTGRSYGATHRLLVASGAELRPRGHPRRVDRGTA